MDIFAEDTKVQKEKHLGVVIDDELNSHQPPSKFVLKARQMLGIIKRTFSRQTRENLPILFVIFVGPHLECGNVFWDSRIKMDDDRIEIVQR